MLWTIRSFGCLLSEAEATSECDEQAEHLTRLLSALSSEEIYAFDRHFAKRRIEAYRWDLWGAAYLISGGCSDDGFEYFRCWLIGRGQAAFEAALNNPESVGDLVEDDEDALECGALLYAADEAYERVTGTEMPPTEITYPAEPAGEPWKEEDLEQRFPKLCERF